MKIRLPFAGKFVQVILQPKEIAKTTKSKIHFEICQLTWSACPLAGAFFVLLLLAGYAGLSSLQVDSVVNDKVLHLVTFFTLTVVCYWIVDTHRRRTLNLTLVTCTLCLGLGSELVQGFLPNGRDFDLYDIVANVAGSLAGLGLCSWYHKRMLERKRSRKQYNAVPGEDTGEDVELGETVFGGEHEEGVIVGEPESAPRTATSGGGNSMTLEEEVDNWDENAVDAWDEDDLGDVGVATSTAGKGKGKAVEVNGDNVEPNKRAD
jgi:VanZ family protein